MKLTNNLETSRRDFLKVPLATGAAALVAVQARGAAASHKNEDDPDNLKIAVKINVHSASDDEMHVDLDGNLKIVRVVFILVGGSCRASSLRCD